MSDSKQQPSRAVESLPSRERTNRIEYVPDDSVGRDNEIEEHEAALQPIINGEYPDDILFRLSRG